MARNRRVRRHRRSEEECCSEADFEETVEEREYLEKLEEGIKEIEDDDEADPWLWMEEYDGYDEDSYGDESYGDDP